MHILQMIDHTVLKANATQSDIEKLCAEAIKYEFASVCVNPVWVKTAKSLLENQNPKNCRPAVCTVIGFPLGATTTEQKVFETHTAIENGADEIDMVINIGNAKAGLWNDVQNDIALVVESAKEASQRTGRGKDKFALNPAQRPVCVKVIFENCYLTKQEIIQICRCCTEAGADFVKTSTGFGTPGKDNDGNAIPIGATPEDVALMKKNIASSMSVKAAGGIRDLASAREMVKAGATRLGCSAGVAIAKELSGEKNSSVSQSDY